MILLTARKPNPETLRIYPYIKPIFEHIHPIIPLKGSLGAILGAMVGANFRSVG